MLTIRLTRKGKKNQPFFKVVVIDKRRSSKGGRPSEILGYVDPLTKRKSFKKERVLHWLKVGAKASPTVHNLLVSEKIIDAKKINKFKKPVLSETEGSKKEATVQTPAIPIAPLAGSSTEAHSKSSGQAAPTPVPEVKVQESVEKLVEAPKVGEKAPEKIAEPEKTA